MSYLILGLEGPALTAPERAWLARDEVGGVILFSRNFVSPGQLRDLVDAIRAIDPAAIVCIDQEGGRVQRIREPATVLPALGTIGSAYEADEDHGLQLAMTHGCLMASEMLALGIDLSLAPVLDVDGGSRVIGDRAFHRDPAVVKVLALAYLKGMHEAGMAACGKHFPGHGTVAEDTHHEIAVDRRALEVLAGSDIVPFTVTARQGLDAMMTGHVCYPAVDDCPAGYSRAWIQGFLRKRMGFEGVVISDDLGMAAAGSAGAMAERLCQALAAGSDFVLVCRPQDVQACVALARDWPAPRGDRRAALRRRRVLSWDAFATAPERATMQAELACLSAS